MYWFSIHFWLSHCINIFSSLTKSLLSRNKLYFMRHIYFICQYLLRLKGFKLCVTFLILRLSQLADLLTDWSDTSSTARTLNHTRTLSALFAPRNFWFWFLFKRRCHLCDDWMCAPTNFYCPRTERTRETARPNALLLSTFNAFSQPSKFEWLWQPVMEFDTYNVTWRRHAVKVLPATKRECCQRFVVTSLWVWKKGHNPIKRVAKDCGLQVSKENRKKLVECQFDWHLSEATPK